MGFLFDEEYYTKSIRNVIDEIMLPKFYAWFSQDQIIPVPHKMGTMKTIQWQAWINETPTANLNQFNTLSTIAFGANKIVLNYLAFQYRFDHLKPSAVSEFVSEDYAGDPNNHFLAFGNAYKLASNEIVKLITHFVITGKVTVKKNSKLSKILVPNMYGLLSLPNQITEEVQVADKDKLDKIFEKIQSGLNKLELGDYFDSPMTVLMDRKIYAKMTDFYTVGANQATAGVTRWRDQLISIIKGFNNDNPVNVHSSNLLENQIIIFPQSPEVLRFYASKYMMPSINDFKAVDSSNIVGSFVDFVLGGLEATERTLLLINIKTS